MSYTFLVTVGGLDPAVTAATAADHTEELGHLEVDKVFALIERLQKVDPSAARKVDVGNIVELGPKAQEMALVIEAQSLAERDIPDYVVPDGVAKVTFNRVPTLDEVPYPVRMEPNLVVEFYSR